jgi:dUTPase
MTTGYYLLRLNVPEALREMYVAAAQKHNHTIRTEKHYDAGFDLFSPAEVTVAGFTTKALNQGVKGAMEFLGLGLGALPLQPRAEAGAGAGAIGVVGAEPLAEPLAVGYYMYPRSSTGSKTPLRLANSVGIIDAGYRGDYIAVFDNWRGTDYQVEKFQRLLQICPPNMTYPMLVEVVDDLGAATLRGTGGFGSSGK